jgi:hypothetical protein
LLVESIEFAVKKMVRLEICVALDQQCGDRCAEERGRGIEMHLTDVGMEAQMDVATKEGLNGLGMR